MTLEKIYPGQLENLRAGRNPEEKVRSIKPNPFNLKHEDLTQKNKRITTEAKGNTYPLQGKTKSILRSSTPRDYRL